MTQRQIFIKHFTPLSEVAEIGDTIVHTIDGKHPRHSRVTSKMHDHVHSLCYIVDSGRVIPHSQAFELRTGYNKRTLDYTPITNIK